MGIRFTSVNAVPLGASPRTLEFLKMLQSGARINEIGREGIPIESWPGLERIGSFVTAIQKVYQYLDLALTDVFLAELQSEEFAKAITLLELMIDGVGLERFMPAFVLGPGAKSAPQDSLWMSAGFRIPVVVNLKNKGVEVWVEGRGSVYVHGEPRTICGFRAEKQQKWECYIRENRFKTGRYPEAWTYKDWPPIPILNERIFGFSTFNEGYEHPLSGAIWLSNGE